MITEMKRITEINAFIAEFDVRLNKDMELQMDDVGKSGETISQLDFEYLVRNHNEIFKIVNLRHLVTSTLNLLAGALIDLQDTTTEYRTMVELHRLKDLVLKCRTEAYNPKK